MSKTRIIVLAMVVFAAAVVVASFVFLAVCETADHYFNPRFYVTQLSKGMTYDQVLAVIPRRLVAEELRSVNDSKAAYAKMTMERQGIHATEVMEFEDALWPITQATGCFLYFDENRVLVDWYITSS